jgi:hypothetical protein
MKLAETLKVQMDVSEDLAGRRAGSRWGRCSAPR